MGMVKEDMKLVGAREDDAEELEGGRWSAATAAKHFFSAKQYLKAEKWNKKHKKNPHTIVRFWKRFQVQGVKILSDFGLTQLPLAMKIEK